jgi:large subunit ribosomal protein L22
MDNASQDVDVNLKGLIVTDARADMGPLLGFRPRWRPRAMGRATPIRKRTSHLIIGVTEQESRRQRRREKEQPAEAPEAGE